jgi:hypothetical protein
MTCLVRLEDGRELWIGARFVEMIARASTTTHQDTAYHDR